MNENLENQVKKLFPDIYEEQARKRLIESGYVVKFQPGDCIMEIGDYIKTMPLVLDGQLKIMREDASGQELLLYYIGPGETCAMSLTCCLNNAISTIRAVAEESTELLAVPVRLLDEMTTEFRSIKGFVMKTYQKKFEELLKTIDSIAFQKLDERLGALLIKKSEAIGSNILQITHQELASELNSSREVISRLLKQMENMDMLNLSRNRIELKKAHLN
jgi:CRP/FNR family transcriptional regulator, anaerobic regulatory protein